MPRYKDGPQEERLRNAVRDYVRRGAERAAGGRNKDVATHIGKTDKWVTMYLNSEAHANLDVSLGLMRFLGWRVDAELKDLLIPEVSFELLEKLHDPAIAAAVRILLSIDDPADQAQRSIPSPGQTTEQSAETTPEVSTRDRSTPRRKAQGRR